MLVLSVQPVTVPAQLEVMLLLKPKLPTIVSAFRISRERNVTLPPSLNVCLLLIQVTLSKIWKSFWFVMSGWLLFAPEVADVLERSSGSSPRSTSLRLMPGDAHLLAPGSSP